MTFYSAHKIRGKIFYVPNRKTWIEITHKILTVENIFILLSNSIPVVKDIKAKFRKTLEHIDLQRNRLNLRGRDLTPYKKPNGDFCCPIIKLIIFDDNEFTSCQNIGKNTIIIRSQFPNDKF